MPTVLERRALNRALLERQLLIERSPMGAAEAVEHLLGLQSQAPESAYIGLWTRLDGFALDDLAGLLRDRGAVRLVLMRSTVHLVGARDALRLRPVLQPMLDKVFAGSNWARGLDGADRAEVMDFGRALVEERPRDPGELRSLLAARWPGADPASLVNALRSWLPLVQLPPRGLWGEGGRVLYTTVEHWLGEPLAAPDPAGVVRRYLAAFGPASVADAQKWSGLSGLRSVFAGMELRTYHDERGRVLYDLPDAPPLPDPRTPVSARFVADFDNLTLSHADRSRILADEHRTRLMTVNGIIRAAVLVDGFVAGTWRVDRARGSATLTVSPFGPIARADRAVLTQEAERLLATTDPGAVHVVDFG
jgi:hypothetical protein